MLTDIRLRSQQLARPEFKDPKDLVSWMGAVQAQEYRMVKWALGIRLKSATLQTINDAYQRGDILRTHVMRPTWHLVAAEDIRWMLKLSSQRIIATPLLKVTEWIFLKVPTPKRMICLKRYWRVITILQNKNWKMRL